LAWSERTEKERHAERCEASLPRHAIQLKGITAAVKMLRGALHDVLFTARNKIKPPPTRLPFCRTFIFGVVFCSYLSSVLSSYFHVG